MEEDRRITRTMELYGDIIDRPRPESKKHKPMPTADRAVQFAPFAALTGHGAVLEEKERQVIERIENESR